MTILPALFSNLPQNVLKCFRGYNLLWHLLAILTYVIAETNLFGIVDRASS